MKFLQLLGIGLLALGFYGFDTFLMHREWAEKSQKAFFEIPSDGGKATLRMGKPIKPPILFGGGDSYYRLAFAREILHTHTWRIRHTECDGPAEGRDVYWTSPMSWLLVGLASVEKFFLKTSPYPDDPDFLILAAYWIHPLLFALSLMGLLGIFGGILKWWQMLPVACAWGTLFSFTEPLRAGSCDHHGLQLIALLFMFLFLTRGLHDEKQFQFRWWIFAGISASIALWIQAFVVLPLLMVLLFAGVFVGALKFSLFKMQTDSLLKKSFCETPFSAAPWMWFSFALAGSSLLFYLIEFAPRTFPQITVLNPWYSILFLTIGFLFFGLEKKQTKWIIGAAILIFITLIWGLFAYLHSDVNNPYWQRLAETIKEFTPALSAWKETPWTFYWWFLAPLHLFIIFLLIRQTWSWKKFLRILPFAACALISVLMTLAYVRFNSFHAAALLGLSLLLLPSLQVKRKVWFGILFSLLMISSFALRTWNDSQYWGDKKLSPWLLEEITQRQAAEEMRPWIQSTPSKPTRVLGGAAMHQMIFQARAPITCSLYWENIEGAKLTAQVLAGTEDREILDLLQNQHITHILIQDTPLTPARWFYLRWGQFPAHPRELSSTLSFRLLTQEHLPEKLKKIPRQSIPFASLLGFQLFEIEKITQ